MGSAVLEGDVRTGDEVFDGAGHQHFAGCRETRHALREVHCDAADIPARSYLKFAGVDPDANFDTEGLNTGPDPDRGAKLWVPETRSRR
jgi:hypothetical protein